MFESKHECESSDGNCVFAKILRFVAFPFCFVIHHWGVAFSILLGLMVLGASMYPDERQPNTPEMVKVKASVFVMGQFAHQRDDDDNIFHDVMLTKDYWIGKYEVTQRQYMEIMGKNPSRKKWRIWEEHPVENVSWYDAMEYCRKLTDRERSAGRLAEDYEYTLPTEAQWEYAACGSYISKGYVFCGSDDLDEVGWFKDNQKMIIWGMQSMSQPIGIKKPNELGIYDMSGNVSEWCLDCCDCFEYGGPRTDTYEYDIVDPCCHTGAYRVHRGGSWDSQHVGCRPQDRNCAKASDCEDTIGFRVVIVPVK